MTTAELWTFLPIGYLLSILIETPILVVGLSKPHPLSRRLFAGVWLTACTYPIVVLVLPAFFDPGSDRFMYLLVAETFAPVAECLLFLLAFGAAAETTGQRVRDMITIIVANLASFLIGDAIFG
jgi:hypothetical protein